MAAADPLSGIIAFLTADTGVDLLVDGRVYGPTLPAAQAQHMPRAAIVVRPAGGGLLGRAFQEYGDTRVIVACYGANGYDAYQVYLAAHAALKQLRHEDHAGCHLMWARLSAAGSTGIDPDTDWPLVLSTWQVLAGETAVEMTS